MAAEIVDAFGAAHPIETIPGGGGIFDVLADGQLIYSKAETGGFPPPGVIPDLLASHES